MAQEQLFASFLLDPESGLEIALQAGSVVEATPLQGPVRPLPGGVTFLEGVMQLRDQMLPVVNLKKRFGMTGTAYGSNPKIAVVRLYDQLLGLMVEDIREVFRAEPEEVVPISPMLQSEDGIVTALIQRDRGQKSAELIDLKAIFPAGKGRVELEKSVPAEPERKQQRTWSRAVIFLCGGQEYGVEVDHVQEITFLTEIDEMFKSGLLEGGLDLRGRTVPVISSPRLLETSPGTSLADQEECRILILVSDECCFGLIVEEVKEILAMPDADILPLPPGEHGGLKGIYPRPSGRDVLLLDLHNLVSLQLEDLRSMSRLKNGKGSEAITGEQQKGTSRHLITENCYLVFRTDRQFAIELKDVVELIESVDILKTPGHHGYRSGVINLRGEVLPVVNLRSFYNSEARTAEKIGPQRLIICQGHGRKVALEVDSIVTIYKQEKYHATPSLHPKMGGRKDTLDRLIEFRGDAGVVEHVLVVNVHNLIRNHLEVASADSEPAEVADRSR